MKTNIDGSTRVVSGASEKAEIRLVEQAIKDRVVMTVDTTIRELVMPQVDELIKQCAIEVTRKWDLSMRMQQNRMDFDTITNIEIKFVKNIIEKQVLEPTTNIKVNYEN